ncbi:MAG: MarR family transcriptional regulator [Planctomycetota bacterium]
MADVLPDCKALLIRRWGEMGGYWGITRTMAEIHALLFVTDSPLCMDDIMRHLHISRGNASMNLRGLVDWGLIHRVHQFGDRKEYFEADTDVWHMFETILRERRRREVEPIVETIERCRGMIASDESGVSSCNAEANEFVRRLDALQTFLTTMGALFELVSRFGSAGVGQLVQYTHAAATAQGPASVQPPIASPDAAAGNAARARGKNARPRGRKAKK